MIKLTQLEYFMAALDHGSIAQGARALFVSQPVFTNAIKTLEAEMGAPLLIRTSRGVQPTELGQKVYQQGLVIFADIHNLNETLSQRLQTTEIHILATPTILVNLLLPANDRFCQLYPHVRLTIKEIQLINAKIDLRPYTFSLFNASYLEEIETLCQGRLERHYCKQKLFDDQFVFYLNAKHPVFQSKNVSFEQLRRYPLIVSRSLSAIIVAAGWHEEQLITDIIDRNNVKELVITQPDLGAFMPKSLVFNDVFVRSGAIRLLEWPSTTDASGENFVLYSKARSLSFIEQAYLQILLEEGQYFQQTLQNKNQVKD